MKPPPLPADAAAPELPTQVAPMPGRVVHVVNHYPAGEVTRAALALFGLLLGLYLLWRVQEVLLLLFLAILLATAIEPLVNRLRRGPFTRGTGVLAVYTLIFVALALPAYLTVPTLLAQATAFVESLADRLLALRGYAADIQPRALQEAVVGALERASNAVRYPAPPPEEKIVEAGATAAHTLLSLMTVFVLAFYWLVERSSIKRTLLRAVPRRHARQVNTVWMEVEEKLGGWVRGQLTLMLAMGLMAGSGYWLLGLPNPVLLGAAAAILEMVPMVGPFLAFAPAVLVALAQDPARAAVVVAFAFVIQQIESNVLVPRVMGRSVGISPLTVILGILVGTVLYGLPGAFLAVPVAGALQVILAHVLRAEDPVQAEVHQATLAPTDPADDGARRAA